MKTIRYKISVIDGDLEYNYNDHVIVIGITICNLQIVMCNLRARKMTNFIC